MCLMLSPRSPADAITELILYRWLRLFKCWVLHTLTSCPYLFTFTCGSLGQRDIKVSFLSSPHSWSSSWDWADFWVGSYTTTCCIGLWHNQPSFTACKNLSSTCYSLPEDLITKGESCVCLCVCLFCVGVCVCVCVCVFFLCVCVCVSVCVHVCADSQIS